MGNPFSDVYGEELEKLLYALEQSEVAPDKKKTQDEAVDKLIQWYYEHGMHCEYMTYAGSRYIDPEPPEYCQEMAMPGQEFCRGHLEEQDAEIDLAEEMAEDRRNG